MKKRSKYVEGLQIVVFDTEFLSNTKQGLCDPNAVVMSIGMCTFRSSQKTFDVREIRTRGVKVNLNVQAQLDAGRTISEDVLSWWSTQPNFTEEIGHKTAPRSALLTLKNWLNIADPDRIMAAPLQAEGPLLVSLCDMFDVDLGIQYNQMRDAHTLFDIIGRDTFPLRPAMLNEHDALDDAVASARHIHHVIRLVNEKSF